MIRLCSLLPVLLLIFLTSSLEQVVTKQTYYAGRFGYSYITLELYSDFNYTFYEFNHTGARQKDAGKWFKTGDKFYLKSEEKTSRKSKAGESKKTFLFKKQEFTWTEDTLKFVKRNQTKDGDYEEQYTFYKATEEK